MSEDAPGPEPEGPDSAEPDAAGPDAPWLMAPPPPPPPASPPADPEGGAPRRRGGGRSGARSGPNPAAKSPTPPTDVTPTVAIAADPTVPIAAAPAPGPNPRAAEPAAGPLPAGESAPAPPLEPGEVPPEAETTPPPREPSPRAGVMGLARAAARDVEDHSPWVLASGAILVTFSLGWVAAILLAFRHQPGLTGRDRVVQFFAPGSLIWALAIVLAVSLLSVGHRLDPIAARKSDTGESLPLALFLAAGVVGVSAVIDLLVELTSFGSGIDVALSSLIGYAAVLPIAAATGWWALKESGKLGL